MAKATLAYGVIDGSSSFCQFMCSPLMGVLCDRFGRKKLLLLSLAGTLIYLMSAIFLSLQGDVTVTLLVLFLGSIITGATSGERIIYFAIISDITLNRERPKFFSCLGLSFGSGVLFGSMIGLITDQLNVNITFIIVLASLTMIADVIFVFLFMKETLPKRLRRMKIPWTKANPIGTLRFYYLERSSKIYLLIPSLFVILMVISILISVFAFFSTVQYHWSISQIFLFLFIAGFFFSSPSSSPSPLLFLFSFYLLFYFDLIKLFIYIFLF